MWAGRDEVQLCGGCWDAIEAASALSPDAGFRNSYAVPSVVLECTGDGVEAVLGKLVLGLPPADQKPPPAASPCHAVEALRRGHARADRLLVLLGAGASAAAGVSPGYGPGAAAALDESLGVDERYASVRLEAERPCPEGGLRFFEGLQEHVALRQDAGALACVATTNIDSRAGGVVEGVLELHGSVLRRQCARRPPCSEDAVWDAPAAGKSCRRCKGKLRLNVSSFDDEPSHVLGIDDAHDLLCAFVGDSLREQRLQVLLVGCSDHVHSLVHEVRAILHERDLARRSTEVIVVNPDPAGSRLLSSDCTTQVTCAAEDLFAQGGSGDSSYST